MHRSIGFGVGKLIEQGSTPFYGSILYISWWSHCDNMERKITQAQFERCECFELTYETSWYALYGGKKQVSSFRQRSWRSQKSRRRAYVSQVNIEISSEFVVVVGLSHSFKTAVQLMLQV